MIVGASMRLKMKLFEVHEFVSNHPNNKKELPSSAYDCAKRCHKCGNTYSLMFYSWSEAAEYGRQHLKYDFKYKCKYPVFPDHNCFHCGATNPTILDSYGVYWE